MRKDCHSVLDARRLSLKFVAVVIVSLAMIPSVASNTGCSLQDVSYYKEEYWRTAVLYQTILESSLEWTPDGELIVFRPVINAKGEGSAYVVRSDGSDIKRISKSDYDDYFVEMGHTISPDGNRLVYITSRHQDGRGLDLETSNLDGSDRRRLMQKEGLLGGSPAWSPDGTRIAFIDNVSGNEELGIIRADGSIELQANLRARIGYRTGRGPQWSPDGQAIAFVAQVGTGAVLYSLNPDGTGLIETFAAPVPQQWKNSISNPSWSANGEWLAFALSYDVAALHENNGLYVVKPDGTGLRRLVAWPEQVESVDWSPDGEEILTGNGLIVKIVDGDTRRVLPLGLSKRTVWSPDGSQMAVLTMGGQLIVANRDGSDRRNLMQAEVP